MKSWIPLRLLGAGLLLAALPAAPVAAQDWNATFVDTGQGHQVGNPDAPLKLIEFVSYTCPHCAHFEGESEAELRYLYVYEGHASLEVRHMIRNIVDVAAALITECGDDENFFGNHRAMLVTQDEWLARAQQLSPAQQARWSTGTFPERMRAIAGDLGFYGLMEPRGYSIAQLDACLADQSRADALVAASQTNANEFNVRGTPSFVLNNTLLEEVHSWPQLQQVLSAAREMPVTSTQ